MGFFRFILVVLISLAVPFVAAAGAVAPLITECPMQTGSDGTVVTTMHDCCDHSTTDQTKPQVCKTGQQCKACSACAAVPAAAAAHSFPGATQWVVALPDYPFLSRDPQGLWRPPRSL